MRVVCNRRRASISPNSADLGDWALRLAWQTCLPLHLSAVYLRSAKGPSGYAARFPWPSCATPSDLGHGCVAKGCQQCDRTRSPRIAPTKTKRAEVNGICTPMLLSELAKRGTGQTNYPAKRWGVRIWFIWDKRANSWVYLASWGYICAYWISASNQLLIRELCTHSLLNLCTPAESVAGNVAS